MKMLNLFGKSMVSVAVLATCCGADAAQNGRVSMMPVAGNVSSARMPTMPTVSLNTIGNPAVHTINQPVEATYNHNIIPTPTPTPTPTPDPKPVSECPDGGVKNSTYTISMCMNDVLQCVNTGALQGGLNDLFNEDVRNSIMGGMKLCQASIDKCIADVRVNCRNVYAESNDVWLDFNSRIVQPEYYNFVLRKTGLTPNQAENTCLLLDRNTYGSSFAAVSDLNAVNNEYNNKVGAYNAANNGTLSKDNPQGVAVNTVGYDGNRGHYARWDAANGECLIRVAAYNKDKLITNNWLFGAVGNNNPAEVWEKAGSTFTCSKELFDFNSLLNDTKTAAVIAVPGGAVLGTAIGAAAGAGAYNKKAAAAEELLDGYYADACTAGEDGGERYRQKLAHAIGNNIAVLNAYLCNEVSVDEDKQSVECKSKLELDRNMLSVDACKAVHDLFAKAELYRAAHKACEKMVTPEMRQRVVGQICVNGDFDCMDKTGNVIKADNMNESYDLYEQYIAYKNNCSFKPLLMLFSLEKADPLCKANKNCVSYEYSKDELVELDRLLAGIESAIDQDALKIAKQIKQNEELNKGKEIGKGAAIGLATGAAAGGVATAITAFVERSNITCKVGDGLNSVALGKAHTIDSLKDFYVKWNLHLPDTVSPTSAVSTKADWEQACSQFNSRISDCPKVQINLKDTNGKYTLVPSACKVSGNICIADDALMTSNGIK